MKMEKLDKNKSKPITYHKTTKAMPKVYEMDSRKNPFERRSSVSRSPPTCSGGPTHLVSSEGDDAAANIRGCRDRSEESMDEVGSGDITLGYIRKERTSWRSSSLTKAIKARKVNKSAIKFILSKWMLLEGKLQEEIMEKEKLKATYQGVMGDKPSGGLLPGRSTYADVLVGGVPETKTKRISKQNEVLIIKALNEEKDTGTNEDIKRQLVEELKVDRRTKETEDQRF